jgi:thiol-disulfide isomerase/thioredoxin
MIPKEVAMICPICHQFTPDQGFKCISCNSILKKKEAYAGQDQVASLRRDDRSFFKPWMLIPLVLLAILAYLYFAQRNQSHAINAHNPGAEMEIETYLQKGKTNIVDFYSDFCPPCRKISPLLQKLGRKRQDLAILPVDINRKGVKGIDWSSPLARQYELASVPYFRIYDGDGNLVKEGQEAWPQILLMLASAGIRL